MHGARRIIIGTSGSPGNLQALRYAAGVARDCDATLVPVLAWLPPGGDLADRRHPSGYLRQIWRDHAWLRMWTALDTAWGGIAPAEARPSRRCSAANPGRCWSRPPASRMICWWSRAGRRGAVRHMISSRVGRYCLAHAACPVVAVPPADLDHAAGHGLRGWAFRHRLVPHGAVPAARRG